MDTNSEEIVQRIRQQFESLLANLLNVADDSRSAYEVERTLFTTLLDLGKSLFLVFILAKEATLCDVKTAKFRGNTLPLHDRRTRALRTVFGKIKFERGYYHGKGQGFYLLDERLNLPAKSTSDLLREWTSLLACYDPYRKVCKTILRILGQELPMHIIEENVSEDGGLVEAFYAQTEAPDPASEEAILVVQADGKGVPMCSNGGSNPGKVRLKKGDKASRKKEAIATAVYTIAPCQRTPEEVADSLFKVGAPRTSKRTGPRNKRLWATLKGKAAAIEFTAEQVRKREGDHIKERVALTDGAEPLQKQVGKYLPGFVLILDVIHAIEYLWAAANSLFGETSSKREDWVKERVLRMLKGQTQEIIDEFRQLAQEPRCKKRAKARLTSVAAYYERNLPYMRYDEYLKSGWPIATGVIEGVCRHLVKDRCELSGMRWSISGAEALLRVRSVAESDDYDAFSVFRLEQRATRNPEKATVTLEHVALAATTTVKQMAA